MPQEAVRYACFSSAGKSVNPSVTALLMLLLSQLSYIPVSTASTYKYPAGYKVVNGAANGVGEPSPLLCEDSSIDAAYDCANQVREYNRGNINTGVLEIISMSPSSGWPGSWDVQYIPYGNPNTVKDGRFALDISRTCDTGYTPSLTALTCEPIEEVGRECPVTAGNPISVYSGEKTEINTDYEGEGQFPIIFNRHYHSKSDSIAAKLVLGMGSIGKKWDHSYSSRISGDLVNSFDYTWFAAGGEQSLWPWIVYYFINNIYLIPCHNVQAIAIGISRCALSHHLSRRSPRRYL